MAEIKKIEGLSLAEIRALVHNGGKFVCYKYCISIVIMTFQRTSSIYFIRPHESAVVPGLDKLFVTLLLGWWGIPWGPIYSNDGIFNVLSGGTDLTAEVISHFNNNDPNYGTGNNYNIPGQSSNSSNDTNTYNIPR